MKCCSQRVCHLVIGFAILSLLDLSIPAQAEELTLARLSFWVPPERIEEFERAYEEQVLSVLKEHGLVESPLRGRVTVDSVFSRLFEVDTPAKVNHKGKKLREDSTFKEILRSLGTDFENIGTDGLLRYEYLLYKTPAGTGRVVSAGPGRKVRAGPGKGRWRTYGPTDGIASGIVESVLQDSDGYLWIGVWGGGLCRYDGQKVKIFTTADGLPDNGVTVIYQDRMENIWIGTGGGLCRYDGHEFTIYTSDDGMVESEVISFYQDRVGNLWAGTESGGLVRYDGREFTLFSIEDGLPGKKIMAFAEDEGGDLWVGTDGGLCRYDGRGFTTFTMEDGLPHSWVNAICRNQEGGLWIGTEGGLSRYDGREFTTFTIEDYCLAEIIDRFPASW